MPAPERFEAIGPRGEACIIIRTADTLPDGSVQAAYALAAGERLRPTDDERVFETFDGKRRFSLRGSPPTFEALATSP